MWLKQNQKGDLGRWWEPFRNCCARLTSQCDHKINAVFLLVEPLYVQLAKPVPSNSIQTGPQDKERHDIIQVPQKLCTTALRLLVETTWYLYCGSGTTTTYISCQLLAATPSKNVCIRQAYAARNVLQTTVSKVLS